MSTPLALPAALTINTVAEFQVAALMQLAELITGEGGPAQPMVLDAAALETMTTPGMQLLLSLEKSLIARASTLTIMNPTDAYMQACLDLGLDDYLVKWSG